MFSKSGLDCLAKEVNKHKKNLKNGRMPNYSVGNNDLEGVFVQRHPKEFQCFIKYKLLLTTGVRLVLGIKYKNISVR